MVLRVIHNGPKSDLAYLSLISNQASENSDFSLFKLNSLCMKNY